MAQIQRALIVGGSSGIGEAAARPFMADGRAVIIASRSPDALTQARSTKLLAQARG